MRTVRVPRLLALLAAGALVLAACTGDDDETTGTTAAPSGAAAGQQATTSAGETTTAAGASGGATTTAAAAGGGGGAAASGPTLAKVRSAGTVRCGTRQDLPGFASLDSSGQHVGFDSDFCRVIAAAALGDASKVEMVDVATADRLTALQSGEIDVLVRNTTWTATRDGREGLTFLQPTFYDGQGMMVTADSGITDLAGLAGTVICVAGGTTNEGNIATEFARQGLAAPQILTFDDVNLLQEAFQAGRCDGWSSDRSQLTGLRSKYPGGANSLVILPGTFSKEPLAPAVRDGDSQWAQVVNWAVLSTIQAEEFGLTKANVADQRTSTTNPSVQQFLGVAVDGTTLDPGLGLAPDFAFQVVSQVGNYGEIYDKNITPLGLDRGVNALWTDGGLLYAPPYR